MQPVRPGALRRVREARDDPELVVLEGFHAVKHALRFGADLLDVVAADVDEVRRLGAQLAPDVAAELVRRAEMVPGEELDGLSSQRLPGRIVAVARRPRDELAEVLARPGEGCAVLLDAPRHLGNVGASIRVAAAAGAEAVAVTGTADPWNPAAVRGAAGLQFALPVGRIDGVERIARPIVALDPEGDPLSGERVPPGAVLAFGSERQGLTAATRAAAADTLSLPMRPGVSSLNLAAAVAAALYALALSR